MMQDDLWLPAPENPVLLADEVHVWRAALAQPEPVYRRLAQTLADDEAARAARFHFERDRRGYTIGRGILRMLLAHYLQCPPPDIRFSYGPQDKPAIIGELNENRLQFNLAHSHGQALYAFTWRREIGVDIEQVRALSDAEAIAGRFFSAGEKATFLSLPPHRRPEGFFNCWTRKEAYIKALGDGLTHPLDTFDVSLVPGEAARLLAVEGDPGEVSRWSMQALAPVSGYVAALVVEGHDRVLRRWNCEL